MLSVNVEVNKNPNENNLSILRRFTKRVQGSGVLTRVRGIRYHERNQSVYNRKKIALKRLRAREDRDLQIKLGKLKPVERGVRK